MRVFIKTCLLLFVCTSCFAQSYSSASFDCNVPLDRAESIVCSFDDLSSLDTTLHRKLTELSLLKAELGPKGAEQVSWLNSVRNKCADPKCLRDAYVLRLTTVEKAIVFLRKKSKSEIELVDRYGSQNVSSGKGSVLLIDSGLFYQNDAIFQEHYWVRDNIKIFGKNVVSWNDDDFAFLEQTLRKQISLELAEATSRAKVSQSRATDDSFYRVRNSGLELGLTSIPKFKQWVNFAKERQRIEFEHRRQLQHEQEMAQRSTAARQSAPVEPSNPSPQYVPIQHSATTQSAIIPQSTPIERSDPSQQDVLIPQSAQAEQREEGRQISAQRTDEKHLLVSKNSEPMQENVKEQAASISSASTYRDSEQMSFLAKIINILGGGVFTFLVLHLMSKNGLFDSASENRLIDSQSLPIKCEKCDSPKVKVLSQDVTDDVWQGTKTVYGTYASGKTKVRHLPTTYVKVIRTWQCVNCGYKWEAAATEEK